MTMKFISMSMMEVNMKFDAERVKNEIVEWIRRWYQENGPDCNAVIGISGGKDSSVAAALCVEALGKDRVIGIMMPNGAQPDIKDAEAIVKHLQIRNAIINIDKAFNACLDNVIQATGVIAQSNHGYSEQARINLSPRLRMTTLYAISQSMNGRVVCTDNFSESWVGYSTRWGDNVGDFAPLADLTSDEVIAIGAACGLPDWAIHKTPADGLTGKSDEDNFGFTYATLNKYLRTGYCDEPGALEKISTLHRRNIFKTEPIPRFVYKPGLLELEDYE